MAGERREFGRQAGRRRVWEDPLGQYNGFCFYFAIRILSRGLTSPLRTNLQRYELSKMGTYTLTSSPVS